MEDKDSLFLLIILTKTQKLNTKHCLSNNYQKRDRSVINM